MAYSSSGVLTRMDLDAGSVGARRLIRNPDASLVTFSPNGQRLSIAQPDGSVQVCAWTGLQCFTLVPGGASVSAVSFSVGGRFVAVVRGDGTLGLWEVSERRPRLSIDAGRQSLVSVDEESGVMALLADDGEVSLWDINSARPLASFRLEEPIGDKFGDIGYKSALAVLSPGPDLYAVTPGGFAYRFHLAPSALVKAACGLAARDFSAQERKTYLSPIVPAAQPVPDAADQRGSSRMRV